jgi:hypothetical protein
MKFLSKKTISLLGKLTSLMSILPFFANIRIIIFLGGWQVPSLKTKQYISLPSLKGVLDGMKDKQK